MTDRSKKETDRSDSQQHWDQCAPAEPTLQRNGQNASDDASKSKQGIVNAALLGIQMESVQQVEHQHAESRAVAEVTNHRLEGEGEIDFGMDEPFETFPDVFENLRQTSHRLGLAKAWHKHQNDECSRE
ncbi:hypothetical protein D3C87_1696600 [compost metagenome]